jgi:hypothetical protein
MGKVGDALRVLLANANISDPGQVETVQAAIDEDEKKNPTPKPEEPKAKEGSK